MCCCAVVLLSHSCEPAITTCVCVICVCRRGGRQTAASISVSTPAALTPNSIFQQAPRAGGPAAELRSVLVLRWSLGRLLVCSPPDWFWTLAAGICVLSSAALETMAEREKGRKKPSVFINRAALCNHSPPPPPPRPTPDKTAPRRHKSLISSEDGWKTTRLSETIKSCL